MDCSLPGSSVHGILQARILEWVAIPSSRGSSQPKDPTQVSCLAGRFFTTESPRKHIYSWYVLNYQHEKFEVTNFFRCDICVCVSMCLRNCPLFYIALCRFEEILIISFEKLVRNFKFTHCWLFTVKVFYNTTHQVGL